MFAERANSSTYVVAGVVDPGVSSWVKAVRQCPGLSEAGYSAVAGR
jgi:hypothetical protein